MGNLTYFDLLAQFGIGGAHPGGFQLTRALLSSEQFNSDTKILDVGCGTGQTAAYLYNQYRANITCIDINPVMLNKAGERFRALQIPIDLQSASIEELPFEDQSFDVVLSESVLVFVNKTRALQEIYRVLKSGGKLIANEMTINYPVSSTAEKEITNFYNIDSLLLEEDWRRILVDAGFSKISLNKQETAMYAQSQMPEFHFSANIDPELFDILNQHAGILIKYQDSLSYRTIQAIKE